MLSLNVSKKYLKIPEIMHIVESAHLRLFYTYQSQLLTKFQDKRSIWRCVPPGQENLPQERGMNLLTGALIRDLGHSAGREPGPLLRDRTDQICMSPRLNANVFTGRIRSA